MTKYFWPSSMVRPGTCQRGPEQPLVAFKRRFRVSETIFERIFTAVVCSSTYFPKGLRADACAKIGITPLLKVICALRQLAYRLPADIADDLFDISETSASLCLIELCTAVNNCFQVEYLRAPTTADLARIEREIKNVGFPGCIGCLDCAGWRWKNCPKALQGVMVGRDGVPTVRMEAICSLDLWIWSFQFGLPGVFNDLNILEVSQHFNEVLCGSFPPCTPSYEIAGQHFSSFYYLTDDIYPSWKIFIKSISDAVDRKGQLFSTSQEGVRKCIERVFGVLFRRFNILFIASELWSVAKMKSIATACVCLHNIIVEEKRDYYEGDRSGGRSVHFEGVTEQHDIKFRSVPTVALAETSMPDLSDNIKVKGLQRDLTSALTEHMWNRYGEAT